MFTFVVLKLFYIIVEQSHTNIYFVAYLWRKWHQKVNIKRMNCICREYNTAISVLQLVLTRGSATLSVKKKEGRTKERKQGGIFKPKHKNTDLWSFIN